jgi:hypothetical protein
VIEPTRGPGAELGTLEDAARFVGLMKPWCQARPHWDFAALLLRAVQTPMLAQTGRRSDIVEATRCPWLFGETRLPPTMPREGAIIFR